MNWITRQEIRVNRTATCWLIRRFIDPEAQFLFIPAEEIASTQVAQDATGFDAPGATYPHRMLRVFALSRRWYMSGWSGRSSSNGDGIVQAADIQGQLEDHPAAHGLQLLSRGFPLVTKDDYETVERASFVYDALYASIMESQVRK